MLLFLVCLIILVWVCIELKELAKKNRIRSYILYIVKRKKQRKLKQAEIIDFEAYKRKRKNRGYK